MALSEPSAVRGLRSESRAIAIAMAASSTARPASWPPISRGSSGTIAASVVTLDRDRWADGNTTPPLLLLPLLVPVPGEIVGNSPPAPPPPEPATGGSVTGGNVTVVVGGVGVGCGVWPGVTTSIEPEALYECAFLPEAVAVSWIVSPLDAESRVQDLACSSSARPAAIAPSEQLAPPEFGQTVKCGEFTSLA